MITRLMPALSAAALGACTSAPAQGPDLAPAPAAFVAARLAGEAEPAPAIVETAIPLPLPGQMKPVAAPQNMRLKSTLPPEKAVEAGRAGALVEPSADGYVNAVQIYPYTEGALYRLYASPGQVSDIALESGEALISVSAGDTVRWVVGDTRSGAGAAARAHVLVKPIAAGLTTNLMIATDRRTYHLELESVETAYMAALSWRYPQDELARLSARGAAAAAREAQVTARALSLEALDFGYRVTGDRPLWRPLRVFDDGRQVFIQMPESAATGELPPLFVLGSGGGAELVNYRIRNNYYVVDRLFEAAELRLGSKPQTVVRITKNHGARTRKGGGSE